MDDTAASSPGRRPVLRVQTPGLHTTVQDLGRPGHYHLGIPEGGALDRSSARLANALVGNPATAAVLECTYLGPTFSADADLVIAVTGATVGITVDGTLHEPWTAIAVPAGASVSFTHVTSGARYYLAVAGGVDVPVVLGSRSTYVAGALGGVGGRAVAAADELPVGDLPTTATAGARLPEEHRPVWSPAPVLRVVPGLYDHRLTEEGRRALYEVEWKLTPLADRTGMRYQGGTLQWRERQPPFGAGSDPSNIVDAGYPVGSIQVPGGNQPIVLHRDAVSGGGYAVVATVVSADLDAVAQAVPGTPTHFEEVSLERALELRAAHRRTLENALEAITGPR